MSTRRKNARVRFDQDRPLAHEPLVTVEDAASFLGVRQSTVYLWAEIGRIPSYKIGALRRFRLSELASQLERHREGPPPSHEEKSWPRARRAP